MKVQMSGNLTEMSTAGTTAENEKKARLVYEGEFTTADVDENGQNIKVRVTREDLERIVANHNAKLAAIEGEIKMSDYPPVQLDHSTSAEATVGRLVGPLEMGEFEGAAALFGRVRILGSDNWEKVEDGRWTHLSVGADFESGQLFEVSVTPFPAAANATLLSKLGVSDMDKSKGHLAFIGNWEFFERSGRVMKAPKDSVIALDTKQRHGRDEGSMSMWDSIKQRYEGGSQMSGKKAKTKLSEKKDQVAADEPNKKELTDDADEDDKKDLAGEENKEEKTELSADADEDDKKDLTADADEDDKKELTADADEDDKKDLAGESDEEDEEDKKKAEKTELAGALASFEKRTAKMRTALKRANLATRFSRLRASAKITPAELRKLNLDELAAQSDCTIDAVLKSYESREPVIRTGQLGSIKAISASELARQERLSQLEAETRENMSLLRGKNKKSNLAGENTQGISPDTKPVEEITMAGDHESMWGEIVKAIQGGDESTAKKLYSKACKMNFGDVGIDETEMKHLMGAFAEIESDFGKVVRLAGAKLGVKV